MATQASMRFVESANRIAVMLMLLFLNENVWSERMATAEVNIDKVRLEFAKEAIRLYGDKIPAQSQKNILKQQIAVGMSPYEAKLAGGAFYYKVEADPKVWPQNADPLVVIDKQSVAPDGSKIWMTFETETQFPNEGRKKFQVYFEKGVVKEIIKQDSVASSDGRFQ